MSRFLRFDIKGHDIDEENDRMIMRHYRYHGCFNVEDLNALVIQSAKIGDDELRKIVFDTKDEHKLIYEVLEDGSLISAHALLESIIDTIANHERFELPNNQGYIDMIEL